MSEHLSALQLDEQASGAAVDPHLASCAECTARLEVLKQQRAAFLARADAQAFAQKLVTRHAAPPPSRASRAFLLLAPLAASLLIFFLWPRGEPGDGQRIKGAPMVMLLDARGTPVTTARVGDELSLALRFSGNEPRQVTVTVIAADGKREPLWSGAVQPNERAVPTRLVVTPGNVEVIADFAPPASQALRVGVAHDLASTKLEVE